jgi:tRNA (cmo5U34)-methyltransferase
VSTEITDTSDYETRRNNFDLVAPFYDALAAFVFAGAIRRAQLALIPNLADANSVLIIGGGTGWFLLEVLRRTPIGRVLYVEKSPKMLNYSRELIQREAPDMLSRVEFRLGTEESIAAADGPFDVIVTNFFLDLFHEDNSAKIAERLSTNLAPTGRWLFVDFTMPENWFMRFCAIVLFKVMFTFFNIMAKMESRWPPNYDRIFSRIGLRTHTQRSFYGAMIHAKLLARVEA